MPMIADLGLDPGRTQLIYEWDARNYLQSLPLEHFMESTTQSTQRKITVESFDVMARMRPDIQCFSELLVQYLLDGDNPDKPRRIVPDNMVFVHSKPINAEGSYMLPVERVLPTLVLEYVSKSNERKDYQDSYKKYEQELQVPFYLVFHPDNEDLRVFRLAGGAYLRLSPNAEGRFSIPDLELEAGLLDGWVRFWFQGELVLLPGDLVDEVLEQKKLRAEAELNALISEQALRSMERKKTAAEHAQLAAEQARLLAEQGQLAAEQEKLAAEQARLLAEQEKLAAEQRAIAAETELARLRQSLTNTQ